MPVTIQKAFFGKGGLPIKAQTSKKALVLFFILISAAALGNGLSDAVYANYFKEAYHADATLRGFIEFPRELPGMLCSLVIAALSMLGDLRLAFIAQALAFTGLTALGLTTPPLAGMLTFLFINSMGMHLFMPLQDAIGISLAEPNQVGRRMGQYASTRMAVGFVAGLVVFFGFRSGLFSFVTPVKTVFLLGAGAFTAAMAVALLLVKTAGPQPKVKRKFKLLFRKQYKYYYLLTVLNGVQKQIAYVFGTWVVVELLRKGADTVSLLLIAASFLSAFFMRYVGKWMDRFGIKKMMYADALSFIVVYVIYGLAVWGIVSHALPEGRWPAMLIYGLFVLDRLSMQLGMVKVLYLRSIAVSNEEITATLSTGISLDHVVAIIAAQVSGLVWLTFGPQWVFFIAAFFSLGNLFVAWRLPSGKKPSSREEVLMSEEAMETETF